jgi:hypothetical protein
MKKMLVVLLVFAMAIGAFAQEVKVTGDVKTGLRLHQDDADTRGKGLVVHPYSDDVDDGTGIRADVVVDASYGNYGAKVGLRSNDGNFVLPYAFAYGNLANDKIKISAGWLDDAAWATQGDWDDNIDNVKGVRFEFKPVEFLNFGLALNNSDTDKGPPIDVVKNFLLETVVGVKLDFDPFTAVLAFRFDGDGDGAVGGVPTEDDGKVMDAAKLIFSFNIKAVDRLTAIIDGGLFNIGAFSDAGFLDAREKIGFQINDKFYVGAVFKEVGWGNANDFYFHANPGIDFAVNDALSLGLGVTVGLGTDTDGTDYDMFFNVKPSLTFNFGANAKAVAWYKLQVEDSTHAYDLSNNIQFDFVFSF